MTPGFYHDNMARAFPLTDASLDAGGSGVAALPHYAIVDCGFVLGARASFDLSADAVRLSSVSRTGTTVTFTFAAGGNLSSATIDFDVDIGDPDLMYVRGESVGLVPGSDSSAACNEVAWEGYVVFGSPSKLADWIADGDTKTGSSAVAVVEPALLMSLAGGAVEAVSIGNDDRTRVNAGAGCPDIVWPNTDTHIEVACAAGRGGARRLLLRSGYNCEVTQDTSRNTITFAPRVGAGLGEPCGEVPLFEGEEPPEGFSLLDGSPACSEVMRSLAGATGPHIAVTAGDGVTVTADPETNTLTILIGQGGG